MDVEEIEEKFSNLTHKILTEEKGSNVKLLGHLIDEVKDVVKSFTTEKSVGTVLKT